jgi:hypothetical protein
MGQFGEAYWFTNFDLKFLFIMLVAMVNITSALLTSTGNYKTTLKYLALIQLCGLVVCVLFIRRVLPCSVNRSQPSMINSARTMFKDKRFFYLYFGYVIAMFGLVVRNFAGDHIYIIMKVLYLLLIISIKK